jgi:Na+-transporting methylmalonyl-CoA/oxaloacetate decarboxylase gamma subunit
MELTDALTVAGLGITVVFSGLLLTSMLIVGFNVLPKLGRGDRSPTAAEDLTPRRRAAAPDDPAVVAVIATVVEVERRLRSGEHGGRLTIDRTR